MGGYGSGRYWGGGSATVEAYRSLSIDELNRSGVLHAGWFGWWQWTDSDGDVTGTITIRSVQDDLLHLDYSLNDRLGS